MEAENPEEGVAFSSLLEESQPEQDTGFPMEADVAGLSFPEGGEQGMLQTGLEEFPYEVKVERGEDEEDAAGLDMEEDEEYGEPSGVLEEGDGEGAGVKIKEEMEDNSCPWFKVDSEAESIEDTATPGGVSSDDFNDPKDFWKRLLDNKRGHSDDHEQYVEDEDKSESGDTSSEYNEEDDANEESDDDWGRRKRGNQQQGHKQRHPPPRIRKGQWRGPKPKRADTTSGTDKGLVTNSIMNIIGGLILSRPTQRDSKSRGMQQRRRGRPQSGATTTARRPHDHPTASSKSPSSESQPLFVEEDLQYSGWRCIICTKEFQSFEELQTHYFTYFSSFNCSECSTNFGLREYCETHISVAHNGTGTVVDQFGTFLVERSSPCLTVTERKNEENNDSSNIWLRCKGCSSLFPGELPFLQHLKNHHPTAFLNVTQIVQNISSSSKDTTLKQFKPLSQAYVNQNCNVRLERVPTHAHAPVLTTVSPGTFESVEEIEDTARRRKPRKQKLKVNELGTPPKLRIPRTQESQRTGPNCDLCNKQYRTWQALQLHRRRFHRLLKNNTIQQPFINQYDGAVPMPVAVEMAPDALSSEIITVKAEPLLFENSEEPEEFGYGGEIDPLADINNSDNGNEQQGPVNRNDGLLLPAFPGEEDDSLPLFSFSQSIFQEDSEPVKQPSSYAKRPSPYVKRPSTYVKRPSTTTYVNEPSTCPECNRTLSNYMNLIKHMRNAHSLLKSSQIRDSFARVLGFPR